MAQRATAQIYAAYLRADSASAIPVFGHFLDTLDRSARASWRLHRHFVAERPTSSGGIVVHRFFLFLTLLFLVPAQALAQGQVKSKHGDWDLRCDTPAGAQNQQCVIMQFVTAQDRENVGLSVVVMKTADKQARILRVLAPLGVLLPRGLGLRIDNTDMGTTGFIRCLPNGCVSEVLMDDTLIQQLRSGKQAMFIIFQTPEEGIGVPISLAGFGEGFDALP
jgi:invasion protein IalB